jgi:predicted nucleic acid binding AN1-type Zn finger protein
MSDQKEGKWLPYNQDGSIHDCKSKSKNGKADEQNHKEITLKMVQKKTRINWHYHKRRTVDERRMIKICEICKEAFNPKYDFARFCDDCVILGLLEELEK